MSTLDDLRDRVARAIQRTACARVGLEPMDPPEGLFYQDAEAALCAVAEATGLTREDVEGLMAGTAHVTRDVTVRTMDGPTTTDPQRPSLCTDCLRYPADPPSKLCPGCEAYQEHVR